MGHPYTQIHYFLSKETDAKEVQDRFVFHRRQKDMFKELGKEKQNVERDKKNKFDKIQQEANNIENIAWEY